MSYPKTFALPTTDELTGLLSAAYFRHLLREQLLPQAQTSGDPLSLMLIDIDNFLGINESYGHAVGDQVLTQVSRIVTANLPKTAIISRYGGDELAAALPDVRLDDAFTLSEDIRRQVAALKLKRSAEVKLTCSIGLAAFPAHGKNDVELMRETDQALYLAKATGRNKVSIPLADSRMITKTSYYTATQLERLAQLAKRVKRNEATLLREALDDLFRKYTDPLSKPPKDEKN
ncbi:MAG: diguanylate cyclase [Chloroflexi bacterium]|nr:diguanylate cyclase [Chloroflexota bacterium]